MSLPSPPEPDQNIPSPCILALGAAPLTLADVVAAVGRLKGLSGVTRAAAKLHLRMLRRNTKDRAVSHVAAAESVKGKESVWNCPRMFVSDKMNS